MAKNAETLITELRAWIAERERELEAARSALETLTSEPGPG